MHTGIGDFEIVITLAFLIGWAILEFVGRRLDRKRQSASDAAKSNVDKPSP